MRFFGPLPDGPLLGAAWGGADVEGIGGIFSGVTLAPPLTTLLVLGNCTTFGVDTDGPGNEVVCTGTMLILLRGATVACPTEVVGNDTILGAGTLGTAWLVGAACVGIVFAVLGGADEYIEPGGPLVPGNPFETGIELTLTERAAGMGC